MQPVSTPAVHPASSPPSALGDAAVNHAEASDAAAKQPPIVSLRDITYTYPNGLQALGGINLAVQRGEFISIVGPSGCGKSTLLRILAGLRPATTGQVDRRFSESDSHPCSMVFQENTLLPWRKVRDNVALQFKFAHRKHATYRDHVSHLLDMVGLRHFADFYPDNLSGGMKRRVALLTAVAPLPELLLLDEPFSALDEPTRVTIHRDMYRLVGEFGITTVLVTHDLAEAISLSDRVLVLSRAPATIVQEYVVGFGKHRDITHLRTQPAFLELYGTLWGALEGELTATTARSDD
jgi:ABC-type nitrate/sulfonate/bicarbonate transport system ATPase subunit